MHVSVLAFSAATHCARSYVEYRYACALRYRYVVRGLWLYGRSRLLCLPRVCVPIAVARFRFGFLCCDALRALLCRISLCLRVALSLCCPWIMALRSIASALSAARLSPTSVARFRFGFLCRDGTWFVSRLLVFIVKARTHDRLFACILHRPPHGRMAVCSRARLSPLCSCARRQIRICRRAGFTVVSFTLSDGVSSRRGRTIFGIRQKCRARHAPHYWRYAWRSGSGSCLRIDFITLRRICQSGTFPVDVSAR